MLQNGFVAKPSVSKLAPTSKAGFVARNVIPLDVRDAYAKLYRQRTEERLNTGPMPALFARRARGDYGPDKSVEQFPRSKGRPLRSDAATESLPGR